MGNSSQRNTASSETARVVRQRNLSVPSEFRASRELRWEAIEGGLSSRFIFLNDTTHGIYVRLPSAPPHTSLWVKCPVCERSNYDGGLNKKIRCACSVVYSVNDDMSVQISSIDSQNDFSRVFEEINSIPEASQRVPELTSLCLGVFRGELLIEFLAGGRPNFQNIFSYFLSPFFQAKTRCLGIGDYFVFGELQFKVLGASPNYGVVTESTCISCTDILSAQHLSRIQILPVRPGRIDTQIFMRDVVPYYTQRTRHAHIGQFIYVGGQEYFVVAVEPRDGVVSRDTQIFFEGDPLEFLSQVKMVPFIEDLPQEFNGLSTDQFVREIKNAYLLPFLQGFRRKLIRGHIFRINGVNFKVADCQPPSGITNEHTNIVYEGEYINRAVELFGLTGISPDINQRMQYLLRQMQQLEEAMNGQAIQGADPEAVRMLPTHTLQSIPEDEENSKCMVCISDYEIGEEVKTLPCFHKYHTECIEKWLSNSNLCPICKNSV